MLVLLGEEHGKFWEMVGEEHKKAAGGDEAKWERTKPRIDGLVKAYGTVCWAHYCRIGPGGLSVTMH